MQFQIGNANCCLEFQFQIGNSNWFLEIQLKLGIPNFKFWKCFQFYFGNISNFNLEIFAAPHPSPDRVKFWKYFQLKIAFLLEFLPKCTLKQCLLHNDLVPIPQCALYTSRCLIYSSLPIKWTVPINRTGYEFLKKS